MMPPKLVGPKSEAWPGLRSTTVVLIPREGKLAREWWVGLLVSSNGMPSNCMVGKTAEEGLALPEADAVGIEAEHARRLLQDFGEIRHRGHEVLNYGTADNRFRGSGIERVALGGRVQGQQYLFLNRYGLRNGVHVQRDGEVLRSARYVEARTSGKTRGGRFDRITTCGQPCSRKMSARIAVDAVTADSGGVVLHNYGCASEWPCLPDPE